MEIKQQLKNLIKRYKKEDKDIQNSLIHSKEFKEQSKCFFREIIFDLENLLKNNDES